MRKAALRNAAIVWISAVLAGCGSTAPGSKASIFPTDMKPMDEIYREHTQKLGLQQDAGPVMQPGTVRDGTADLDGYTRGAQTEIGALFPRLPNPTLIMFVYPHLTEQGTPVPGYATQFEMYERSEYALPGEVSINAEERP